ncbi:MAG: ABC transporter ATP-binding protein [Candidatus Hydrogenedentes bacterium]|nr:ABC transporter ATP-binding protein [Candidatus Hydrogenedentota bacterium]
MDSPIIEIKDLVTTYYGNTVIKGLSTNFYHNQFTVILGPNGSGKTTLLKSILGLCNIASGEVKVFGEKVHKWKYKIRRRIAYVSQVENIDPRLPITIEESVLLGRAGVRGLGKPYTKNDRELVTQILERLGIAHLREKPIGKVSGGERQKASIARALVQEAPIILMDEPTASLDPNAQLEILSIINNLKELHKNTTIYVTHELAELPEKCDRIIMLKDGNIWRDGNPEELLNEDLLLELYGGSDFCCRDRLKHH